MPKRLENITNFIFTYHKRKKLERELGCSFNYLQNDIVLTITKKINQKISSTRLYDLGGVNNLSMLVHFNEDGNRIAITKIQKSYLAEREGRFLEWQKECFETILTADYFGSSKIKKTQYSWVSFEYLSAIKSYNDRNIKELYQSLNVESKYIKKLALDGSLQSLVLELKADTKIKAILREVVCDFPSSESAAYLNDFFNERRLFFINHMTEYQKIMELLSLLKQWEKSKEITDMYGLVHGDFKKQNIMKSRTGEYKIIDLQYYTYGIRVWDLAFYYSKSNLRLLDILHDIIPSYSLTESEEYVFTLFFAIASSLHLKKSNAIELINERIKPAIEHCYELNCGQMLMSKL